MARTLDLLTELTGPDHRARLDAELGATTVQLTANATDLATPPAQVALATVAMLCVRVGMRVEADLPDVPCLVELPAMTGRTFGEALLAGLPRWFPDEASAPAVGRHLVVAIGGSGVPRSSEALRLVARGRRAGLRPDPRAAGWDPEGPLVALAAAGLAAGEILKRVLATFPTVPDEYVAPDWPTWALPYAVPDEVRLGDIEAISAGAIIQNLVWTLAADHRISGSIRVFDRDRLEGSNLNRCPMSVVEGIGRPKVDVMADLAPARLGVQPVAAHLDSETSGLIRPGSILVVGADDVAVRHVAQRLLPAWLGIGATSHLLAYVTEHRPGGPCAGCAHPRIGEDLGTIPTMSIVSFWAGFLLAVRLIGQALGVPRLPSHAATVFWPLRPGSSIDHGLRIDPACPVHGPAALAWVR